MREKREKNNESIMHTIIIASIARNNDEQVSFIASTLAEVALSYNNKMCKLIYYLMVCECIFVYVYSMELSLTIICRHWWLHFPFRSMRESKCDADFLFYFVFFFFFSILFRSKQWMYEFNLNWRITLLSTCFPIQQTMLLQTNWIEWTKRKRKL